MFCFVGIKLQLLVKECKHLRMKGMKLAFRLITSLQLTLLMD